MTILKQPSKIVIDRSMTIFARIRNGLSQKIVIDRLMTIFAGIRNWLYHEVVIDWSMTISARIGNGLSQKIVIDWSMTIFWQLFGPIGSCLKQRIIPLYGHTTYGHMSLTTVNDKSLWTKLKKVSLTLVNDKKIVIDHGQ